MVSWDSVSFSYTEAMRHQCPAVKEPWGMGRVRKDRVCFEPLIGISDKIYKSLFMRVYSSLTEEAKTKHR